MRKGTTMALGLEIVTLPVTAKLPSVTVLVATTVHVELPALAPAVPVWLAGATDLSNDQATERSNDAVAVGATSSATERGVGHGAVDVLARVGRRTSRHPRRN